MAQPKASVILVPGGVTLALLLVGWGGFRLFTNSRDRTAAETPPPSSAPSLSPVESAAPLLRPEVRADSDKDGLPDDFERIYQTDAENADTDGDSYQDGLEVANGYDPLKKAPGDKITIPALVEPSPAPTYTEQFVNQTGLTADSKTLLQNEELPEFIAAANVRGFLPEIPDSELRIVPNAGKDAVARYLDAVSIPQNTRIISVSAGEISTAFRTLTSTSDTGPLQNLVGKLSTNVAELKKAPVPGEALAFHRQYVAASQALKENAEKLLSYRTDVIGALVAAARIENLRSVFLAVSEGIKDLEKKYGLT